MFAGHLLRTPLRVEGPAGLRLSAADVAAAGSSQIKRSHFDTVLRLRVYLLTLNPRMASFVAGGLDALPGEVSY